LLCDLLAREQEEQERLGDPDYSYIVNSAVRYKAEEPHLHWWLQILPRLVTPAGFEIDSGMRINPALPEENAELLRVD
jgi:UDPglucose--hexose-1-phosphate uridylyltransferase